MAIRKYTNKSKKHKTIKKRISKATKRFLKYSKQVKNHRKTKSRHSKSHKNKKNMKGGFSGCGLATVKEAGINVPALGSISGISIPDTQAAIYRPNCKTDTNQAMTP